MTKWTDALKIWNADKPSWSIPKKGTAGYNQVKQIMNNEQNVIVADTQPQSGDGIFDNSIKQLTKDIPEVAVFMKEALPIFNKIADTKLSEIPEALKRKNIEKHLGALNKKAGLVKYKGLNKKLSKNPNVKKYLGKGMNGAGMEQRGGFLGVVAEVLAPFVIQGIINTAKGEPFFGKALRLMGGDMNDMKYDKKQIAFLKAMEGEKKSAKTNKAQDARVMRKYKKNLKSMSGSGVEDIILNNPEESFEVGKVLFGTPTAPTVKNGKVVLPPTPLENLWNSIF